MPPGLRSSRVVSALAALAVVATGLVVPGVAQASGSPAVTLTITPTSVASGAPVELKASMPVRDDTGTVAQEIVQTIDPTKVKLTAATDIVAPQGWTLSYSFDNGSTWTGTAPTSATGTATSWDKVTAVKASGSLVTDGSDAGRQVASANVSGPVQSLAPATLQSTVGDGYQAFFDPARTRVFNVYHHTSRSIDCWVIQTGAKCAGFPFAFGLGTDTSQTLNRSTARVVGNNVWISGYGGLYCVDIAAVLATPQSTITNKALTANVATLTTSDPHGLTVGGTVAVSGVGAPFDGTYFVTSTPTPTTFTYAKTNANVAAASASGRVGGVPANCSTPKVALRATGQYSVFAGAATSGESNETKLYAVDGKAGGTRVACVDTATMTSCGEMDTGWGVSATPSGQNSESIVKWGNQVYVSQVKLSVVSPYTTRVTCFVVTTGQFCSGWSSPYDFRVDNTRAGGDMTWLAGGQLFTLPDASGQTRAVCWARPTTTATDPIHCWTTSSTPVNGRTAYGLPQFSDSWNTFDFAIATTQGSRVYVGDANYTTTTATKVYCYDAAANAGAGGKCNERDLFSAVYNNYTVTPDPLIPNCLWITRHSTPVISTVNILNDTSGCGSIAPVQVSFSGTTSVPRMGCSDDSAIAQWRSFTLTSPTSGFTSLRLTVQDSSGVVIPGWDDTPISATVPTDLGGLSVSLTGQQPNFIVRPVGISGSVTATAEIKAVGDSPQLCLTPVTLPPCPNTTVIKASQLADASTSVTASGSTTPGGSVVGDTEPVTILKPSESQCGGTLTGRAGTLTLGTTGDAIPGAIATLLDDTGNVLKDDSGVDITATTDASGNYSFGYLKPANYKVRFPDSGVTSSSVAAVISSVTVASGGSGTNNASAQCPGSWSFDATTSTCVRTITATTADVGAPVGVTLSYLVVGGGGGGAAYSTNALTLGGAGGQVTSGSAVTSGTVGVTVGAGGGANATGGSSTLSGIVGGTVTATGGAGGGGSNPPGAGTSSSLSGTAATYGVGGPNWSGAAYASAGQTGTANRGNGGGAGWRSYEGAGCYYPGAGHVFVNPGGPCGDGNTGTYENGGWSTIQAAGAGGSGVVVLRYPVQLRSNSATVPVGGAAVVNALYIAQPIARPNTSVGKQGAVQTIAVLADDSASTGASYSGGSTALKLCGSGQSYPSCTATSVFVTGQGTYAISSSSVTFTPCSGNNTPAGIGCTGAFTGTATAATYQSTDSAGRTASSTITPLVVAVPTAVNDANIGAWNTPQIFTPLANDSAGAGSTLTSTVKICASSVTTPSSCTTTTSLSVTGGTYVLNANGTVTFTPTSTFVGVAPAIKYVVTDSLGQQSLATITPTVSAPPSPVAASETKAVQPGSSVAFTTVTGGGGLGTSGGPALVTSNSTLGTGLCPVGTVLPGQVANCTQTAVTIAGQGTYSLNVATGVVTYTTYANATTGTKTPITYVIRDAVTSGGRTNWASATLTPFIPGPPVARDDTAAMAWDVTQSVNVLGNDSADTGQLLVASSVRLCGAGDVSPACDDTVVTTAQGTYTVNLATGEVSFDPLPTFWGTASPITYTVTDSQGLKDPATLTVTVAAPGLPEARDDTVLVVPGGVATFPALMGSGGLSASGGPALTSACLWVSGACDSDDSVVVAGEGVWRLDPTTYEPIFTPCAAAGVPDVSCAGVLVGQPAPLTYRVTDAVGQSATGVLTARVPVPPVSRDDSSMAEAGATQVITPLGNDQAGDAALDVATLQLCGQAPNAQTPPNCDQLSVTTAAGTYTVTGGSVTFVPADDAAGTDVDVTYQVADVFGQTSSAAIRVTELPKPAPRTSPDALVGPYGQPLTFTPRSNDTFGTVPADDSTNNVLTQVLGTGWLAGSLKLCDAGQAPPNCTATIVTTADGTYVVSGDDVTFTGKASFTGVAAQPVMYQVANTYDVVVTDYTGSGTPQSTTYSKVGSSTITPTITVAPVSVTPDSVLTPWNTPVTDNVLANDSSGAAINAGGLKLCGPYDAGACAQTSVTVPGKGTFEVVAGGVRFTPLPSFSGSADPITYRTTDALGRPITSTFTPSVGTPVGPSASPEAVSVVRGAAVAFTSLASGQGLVAPGANPGGTNAVQDGATCLLDPPANSSCIAGTTLVVAGVGSYEWDPVSGVVRFTSDPQAIPGAQPPVRYRVVDSLGLTAESSLTATVYGLPVVQPQERTDVINADQVFDVLADDTHDPATSIAASSVRLCDAGDVPPRCQAMTVTFAGFGVFTVDGTTGTITFDPDDTYVGPGPTVTYSVTDGFAQEASATITPTVVGLPRPAAANDTAAANVGLPVTFRPWTNDDTVSGVTPASVTSAVLNPLSIALCGPGDVPLPLGSGCDDTTVVTVDGTYVLDPATGEVTFTGASGFSGVATNPVTYQITTDYQINGGATQHGYASATLTPTITASSSGGGGGGGTGGGGTPPPGGGGGGGGGTPPPGPIPVPVPDRGVGRPGEPVRIDPIGNDTPGQGQVFDEGTLRLCLEGTTPPDCTGLVVQTDQGTWTVDPFTGAVVFKPAPGFKGLVEVPYVVQTEDGAVVDSVISIWITDPPAASDDASSGRVDRPQTLDPWTNDEHDAAPWDTSSLRLCGAGQTPPGCDQSRVETADGVYEIDPATGKVIFTPAPGFTGTATPIQYQVTDVAGQVAHAWLRPTVRADGGTDPEPEPEPDPGVGWLTVRKVVTGNDLRTGAVMIVTTCRGEGAQQRRVHKLPVTSSRGVWRVKVPAGMRCQVAETAHGAPQARGVSPTWRDRRWTVDHTPTVTVGQRVGVGTAVPIDKLILKAKGGCQVRAGVLEAMAVGTCTITWRVPKGEVTTTTTWTHAGPRGTRVEQGTLTRAFPVRAGAQATVTFHNRYRAQDQTVTRTLYITPQCPANAPKLATWTAPWSSPQAMAAYAPRGGPSDPGTCPPRS